MHLADKLLEPRLFPGLALDVLQDVRLGDHLVAVAGAASARGYSNSCNPTLSLIREN
jgi:hypothetical protein